MLEKLKHKLSSCWRKTLTISLLIVAVVTGVNSYQNKYKMTKIYSLYNTLNDYGFSSQEQKDALEHLMQQASILAPGQSIQDKFQNKHNYEDLAADILEFVQLTQKYFTIRSGNQERWEIIPHEWMTKNEPENFQLLKTLGMTLAIEPKVQAIDALCILGGAMSRMRDRMDYAALLVENGLKAHKLILLSGERYVTVAIDGTQEELNQIASSYQLADSSQLTETHLIQKVYEESALHNKIPTYVIDTPARDLPRPTTQTTILELIEWLKQHNETKTIIFVSNQPYVKYQEAVIKEIMMDLAATINVEVVGSSCSNDKVQPIIEALGSFILAATPNVLIKSGEKIKNPLLIDSFRALYAKQPLVYHHLENNLFANPATK
jgi:hypothetical protein